MRTHVRGRVKWIKNRLTFLNNGIPFLCCRHAISKFTIQPLVECLVHVLVAVSNCLAKLALPKKIVLTCIAHSVSTLLPIVPHAWCSVEWYVVPPLKEAKTSPQTHQPSLLQIFHMAVSQISHFLFMYIKPFKLINNEDSTYTSSFFSPYFIEP